MTTNTPPDAAPTNLQVRDVRRRALVAYLAERFKDHIDAAEPVAVHTLMEWYNAMRSLVEPEAFGSRSPFTGYRR